MAKKKKRIIILLIVIVLIIVISVVLINIIKTNKKSGKSENEIYVEVLEDGTKRNTSNKLKENKKFNDLQISNITIEEKNNQTILKTDVTNLTNTNQGDYAIYIILKDDQGNEIKKIAGYLDHMNPHEKTELNIKTSYDFANVYDFAIEKQ